MRFDPHVAVIRFGMGLSPHQPLPASATDLLAEVTGPDHMATRFPIPRYAEATPSMHEQAMAVRARREAEGTDQHTLAKAKVEALQLKARGTLVNATRATFARAIDVPFGLRERLTAFWADHFTVIANAGNRRHLVTPYIEEAIRPHLAGRFADMLRAVETHPMMLMYLQQAGSVGPNSVLGRKRGRGLNENLAREMMELHTLGVDGGYSQADVRQLAELLAGLTTTPSRGQFYDPQRAEPGAETVLDVTYGAEADQSVIDAVIDNLATHPATARHIAQKLAAHFVADAPDPTLIAAIESTFRQTDGDLLACYETVLTHPMAWASPPEKVRPPFDFLVSSVRALGLSSADLAELPMRAARQFFEYPLRLMGQPWQRPTGPDGWADTAQDWIIPQTMAARITWAMSVPREVIDPLPDPRDVVYWALGPNPDPAVVFAASSAETRRDGIGVILASAAFNRR